LIDYWEKSPKEQSEAEAFVTSYPSKSHTDFVIILTMINLNEHSLRLKSNLGLRSCGALKSILANKKIEML